jgi:DNA-binding transcriptional MerR regulator
MLTIGALAKATDTKVVTVRYYEQAGLPPTLHRQNRDHFREKPYSDA